MPPHKRLPWDASGASHDGTLWPRHYGVTGIPTISQVMNGVEAGYTCAVDSDAGARGFAKGSPYTDVPPGDRKIKLCQFRTGKTLSNCARP